MRIGKGAFGGGSCGGDDLGDVGGLGDGLGM